MRWTNPGHPQTLQIAVILLYISAVFSLFTGSGLGLLIGVAGAVAGVAIANDRRIGWFGGIAVAAIAPLLALWVIWDQGLGVLLDLRFLINLVFPIALFAALIHRESSSYTKTWFQ